MWAAIRVFAAPYVEGLQWLVIVAALVLVGFMSTKVHGIRASLDAAALLTSQQRTPWA